MTERLSQVPYDLGPLGDGVTILPLERRDGYALYPNQTGELVKQLRAAGVPSQYLDPPEERRWQDLKGEVTPDVILLGLGLNLVANAVWAGLELTLRKVFGSGKLKVHFVRQTREGDGSVRNEWFEAEGDAKDVADVAKALATRNER